MRRPDHGKLMDRLRKEVADYLANHDGRPPAPRVYRLRETFKRWLTERADYQQQIDTDSGGIRSESNLAYPRARIRELDEKIAELTKLDLRTDEERRGHNRKDYVRAKDTAFRGIPDDVVEKIEKRMAKEQRDREARQVEHARLIATPGNPERQAEYERRRSYLRDHLRWHNRARNLMAEEAIAERHGHDFELDKYQRAAVDGYIDLLARLDSLDEEFADCDTAYLRPTYKDGPMPDPETYQPDPYDDDAEDYCTPTN